MKNQPEINWEREGLTRPRLSVLIGCDCDPDTPRRGGVPYDSFEPLKWRGVSDGIPRFEGLRDALKEDFPASPVRITWCVRADDQIRQVHGDFAWAFTAFEHVWRGVQSRGDEIGWHPHLWRWDRDAQVWYQEINDHAWSLGWLEDAHNALCQASGQRLLASRTGWEYHNNETMRAFAEMGLKLDFSAVPGRKTSGYTVSDGKGFHEFHDWAVTDEAPYKPSVVDYRRPARAGERHHDIWEVPNGAFRSGFWRALSASRSALRSLLQGNFRSVFAGPAWHSPCNTAGIATHPAIFRCLASGKLAQAVREGHAILSVSFHADELLPQGGVLPAVTAAEHIGLNLRRLLMGADERGVEVVFVTASELRGALSRLRDPVGQMAAAGSTE